MINHIELIKLEKQILSLLLIFIIGLVLSGVTAFPLEREINIANQWMLNLQWNNAFSNWIKTVCLGINETNAKYPFIAYGTDWLAFAHLVIAIAFIGPLRNPVQNIWVVEFGLIACVSILPFAFIAGYFRGIPFFWQLLDCSFGIFGFIILLMCYRKIQQLEKMAPVSNI